MSVQLTHYTREAAAVLNILSNGFAWVPNRRNVISKLVPVHDFSDREPQQFGMISFTELTPDEAKEHRNRFGSYGIVVSEKWARKHRAQKVLYVDQAGPVFEALVEVFEEGYKDVSSKIRFPDDAAWQMAYTNKAIASAVAGSRVWAGLLQLYEYVEPIENSYQREWRIVHPDPYYGYAPTTAEIIKSISPPQGWAKVHNVAMVEPKDVVGFVCPRDEQDALKNSLPDEYGSKPLTTV